MPEAEPVQVPTLIWLLQSGGMVPLALGLFLAALGLYFVIQPNRWGALILAALSLLPAMIGLLAVYSAATELSILGASAVAPKPADLAAVTGRALGNSFWSLLGTIIPGVVALLAQWRAGTSPPSTP